MPHVRAVALLIVASAFTIHCAPVFTGGEGGGPGSTGTGATAANGGSTAASSCLTPGGPGIGIFSQATGQGAWSDPATGLAGNLFLEPASAGGIYPGPSGADAKYTQNEPFYGQIENDPSFGVWFSGCVDASAFSGISYTMSPLSCPPDLTPSCGC